MISYFITQKKETKMEEFTKVFVVFFGGVVAAIVVGLIGSLPVMWLWNGCLVAAIPGIKEINWLQAWGILVLCNSLFSGTSTTRSSN